MAWAWIVKVPLYVPEGRFGSVDKLMLKFMTSECEPVRLFPIMRVEESCRPALAAPNGTVCVKAVSGPALLEIWKLADGILFPAPSVKAETELEKKAYTFTLPTLGFSSQEVVAVMDVLPELVALPDVRLKFTAPLESEIETESLSPAWRVMVLAPEFRTWASAKPWHAANKSRTAHVLPIFVPSVIAVGFVF